MTRDQDFLAGVMPVGFLDCVLDWIKENLDPDDVFDDDELIAWTRRNTRPDDVFDSDTLGNWAEENGYEYEV